MVLEYLVLLSVWFFIYCRVCVGQSVVRCRNLYSQYGGQLLSLSLHMFLFVTFVFLVHSDVRHGSCKEVGEQQKNLQTEILQTSMSLQYMYICIDEIVSVLCICLSDS